MLEGEEEGNIFYVAKNLADKVLGEGKYEVLEEMTGKDLEYVPYEPPFKRLYMEKTLIM